MAADLLIAGYLRAESGVGESARLLSRAAESLGLDFETLTYGRTEARQHAPVDARTGTSAPVALVAVNADQFLHFATDTPGLFRARTVVGYWAWEVDLFPREWTKSAELVHEVWTNNDIARDAISAVVPVPVRTFPLCVEVPNPVEPRVDLVAESQARPIVLFVFDYDSVFDRKNPLGAVAAYRRAVPEPGDPLLLIKTINAHRHRDSARRLLESTADRSDIVVFDRYLSREETNGLIGSCAVYLSLHRAEGFGLTIAEAMVRGRPVVVTGDAGNAVFTDPDAAMLVPSTRSRVGPGREPYPADATWAEPDLDAAADMLRELLEDESRREALGRRARSHMIAEHTVEARGEQLGRELARLTAGGPQRDLLPAVRRARRGLLRSRVVDRLAAAMGRRP